MSKFYSGVPLLSLTQLGKFAQTLMHQFNYKHASTSIYHLKKEQGKGKSHQTKGK